MFPENDLALAILPGSWCSSLNKLKKSWLPLLKSFDEIGNGQELESFRLTLCFLAIGSQYIKLSSASLWKLVPSSGSTKCIESSKSESYEVFAVLDECSVKESGISRSNALIITFKK